MMEKLRRKFKSRKKGSSEGFTLVEILLAVTILSIAIMPLVSIFVTTARINSNSRKRLQATITADSVIEAAKGISMAEFYAQCTGTGSLTMFNDLSDDASYGWVDVSYDPPVNNVIDVTTVKVTSDIKKASDLGNYQEGAERYSYLVKGIAQGNKSYDALIIFQKQPEHTVDIKGTAYNVDKTFYQDALYAYKIYVLVFKHTGNSYNTGNPVKKEVNATGDKVLDYVTSIQGSKRDSTKLY